MKKDKLAILVNSCDLYESVWDPFFKLFSIQWSNCPYDIYLNTENKAYECTFMNVKTICTGSDIPWTSRIKKALNEIDAEFVLFFLEDFFLLKEINQNDFNEIFQAFKNDLKVGFLFIHPMDTLNYRAKCKRNEYYSELRRSHEYRVNACVGLWRKNFLLQLLLDDANPWEWERNASRLSLISKYKCCDLNTEYENVIPYSIYVERGYGITKRRWLFKNRELFEKYNIKVDFEELGIEEPRKIINSDDKVNDREIILKELAYTNIIELLKIIKNRISIYFKDAFLAHFILKNRFKKHCKSIEKVK